MAIPAWTAAGYLPAGEHLCTLDEVQQSFATNEHREALLERLHAFLDWLVATESLSMPVYVDGSFTTNKPKPSDVDVVMDLAQATNEEIGKAGLLPVSQTPSLGVMMKPEVVHGNEKNIRQRVQA